MIGISYTIEFDQLVTDPTRGICKNAGEPPFFKDASYGWDEFFPKHPVLDLRTLAYPQQPSRTQAQLQNDLDNAGPGGIVELLPMEVITLGTPLEPLIITKGVTLKTQGDPDPSHYAQMGRLVRIGTNVEEEKWPMVVIQTGGTLSGVWVDGQRVIIGGNRRYESMNVLIQDDGDYPVSNPDITQTRFVENRLTDSIGGSLVQVQGAAEGWPCGNVYLGQNLLTAYANKHQGDFLGAQWTDGFAVPCAHTTVEDNEFVDISDVGVVLFRGGEGVVQSSVVRNNVMLNAGISAFGGFGADPFYTCGGQAQEYDFSGARIEDNLIWASPTTHVDVMLFAGTYGWEFKDENCRPPDAILNNTGWGVTFSGNTTGDKNICPSCTVRTNNPIMVSGMYSTNIGCNPLRVVIDQLTNCPRPGSGENLVLASIKEPHAWASFQPPIPLYTDKHIKHCMEHPEDPTPLPPQIRVVPCFWYFMPLILKNFSVGGERSGPLPPPPEGGYPAPSPRPILPPTPAPPPDYPPPATPLSTPTPAPAP